MELLGEALAEFYETFTKDYKKQWKIKGGNQNGKY